MATKVIVRVTRKETAEGESRICLESIRKPEDTVSYELPIEYQAEEQHPEIFRLSTIRTAVRSLKKNGQYRHVNLTLSLELFRNYCDDEENFMFNGVFIEESEIVTRKTISTPEADPALADLINKLKDFTDFAKIFNGSQEFDMSEVERRFDIEVFTGKEKASDWLEVFLNECARFKITADEQKIKCLKIFVKKSAE